MSSVATEGAPRSRTGGSEMGEECATKLGIDLAAVYAPFHYLVITGDQEIKPKTKTRVQRRRDLSWIHRLRGRPKATAPPIPEPSTRMQQSFPHTFTDDPQGPEAGLSFLPREFQSSFASVKSFDLKSLESPDEPDRILCDVCSGTLIDRLQQAQGGKDEDEGLGRGYITSEPLSYQPDEKASGRHIASACFPTPDRDTGLAAECTERISWHPWSADAGLEIPIEPKRERYASTLDQWPAPSRHGKRSFVTDRPSRRMRIGLMALEAAGGLLMSQWRWSWPCNPSMAYCQGLCGGSSIRNYSAWGGSTPEAVSLFDHPGVLFLGIASSCASLALHYHLAPGRNRDLILIATIWSTVVMGPLLGIDAPTLLLRVAPWAGMLALWASSCFGSGRKPSAQ